jgi:hypothetical protein
MHAPALLGRGNAGFRYACATLVMAAMVCAPLALGQQNISYDKLNDCQERRFRTFHPGSTPPGPPAWKSLDDSQRLEYAGGTQALGTVKVASNACEALEEVSAVDAIMGSNPNLPSADQFHLEVNWAANTSNIIAGIPGWSEHISWLHPGQFGFQENREGNPFLGLVVLFGKDNPKVGQFHIGFRSGFSHYFADNGNISKNYNRYRTWYGAINGYGPRATLAESTGFDWRAEQMTSASPSDNIVDTVRSFLTEWYVQQNIDNLSRFVAADNAMEALSAEGLLPKGSKGARWIDLFLDAFSERRALTVHIESLSAAVEYREPSGSHFSYLNDPARDHFAVIRPTSATEMFFPPDSLPVDKMDPEARFLKRLRREYADRLNLVVYVTKSEGLVNEGNILFWIKENGVWKLSAFQGTD